MAEVISIDTPPDLTKPISITVDIGKLKLGGKLQVAISQLNKEPQQPELQVHEVKNQLHTITYTPQDPGIYTFTLRYGSKKVVGSPLKLNLSPPSGHLATVARQPTGKIKAGQSIEVVFDSFPAGRGEFTATCVGNETGKIDVSISREGISNNFLVKFLPPHEDVYHLSVFYSGVPVKRSPYLIDLIPVRPDRVKCSNIRLPEDRSGPLEMDISTAGCGKARLTSTCTNKAGDKFPVKIKPTSKDNNHHLTVENLPKEDTLTLNVRFWNKHVPGSPFIFPGTDSEDNCSILKAPPPPSQPDRIKLGELHVPDSAGEDKAVWIDVDCCAAGSGSLTAKCTNKNEGGDEEEPVDVTVKELEQKRNYRVEFNATKQAKYTLLLLYNGKPVPDGTFEMEILQPPDPTKVKLGDLHVPLTAGKDKMVWIDADCSQAGPGALTAKCTCNKGEEEELVDVIIKELETSKGNYRVEFESMNPAKYTLSLLSDGKPIPDGMFEMDILPPPDPTKVKLGDLHIPEETGTEEAWINIDCSEAGNGKVEAKCSRKSGGDSVNVDIEESGTYRAKFIPMCPDIYSLSIFFEGDLVPGGNFEVPIPAPDPTKIKLSDLQAPRYVGTKPVSVEADCSRAGYGTLSAECVLKSNEKYKIAISVQEMETPKTFHLEFIPELVDIYLLSLHFNGESIPGGNFEIEILPKPDPSKVIVGRLHVPEFAGNEVAWVGVDCSKAGHGAVLTAECIRNNENAVNVQIEEMSTEGNYQVKFTPSVPDSYSLSLFLEREPIPNGLLEAKVFQKPDPGRVRLGELHIPDFAGDDDAWIDVNCAGAGHGMLEADCVMKNTSSSSEVSLDPLDPQESYRVKFTPSVPDVYNLSLFFGGEEIPGGRFEADIQQRPTPNNVKLGELHVPEFAGAESAWIDVDCSKAGHGILTAECRRLNDENLVEVSLDNLTTQGNYRVKFVPLFPGTYVLTLLFGNQPIPRGLLEANILCRPDASNIKLGELQAPEFANDEWAWIDVDCSEAGHATLEAECTRRNGDLCQVSIEKLSPEGNQRVKFFPNIPDVYTLSLEFGGVAVPDGVFEATFASHPDPSKVKLGKLHLPEFAGEEEAWLDVDVSQAGTGSVAAECNRRNDENAVKVLVDELVAKETYRVKFQPLHPDSYFLSLSFAGNPVPGGSYSVDIHPKLNPGLVRFGELHVPKFANEEMGWVNVDCSKAGRGTLTAECLHDPVIAQQWVYTDSLLGWTTVTPECDGYIGNFIVDVEIEETSKDYYRVHFPTSDPGDYTLTLSYADERIPNGTFEMHVPAKPDPAKVRLGPLNVPDSHGEEDVWIDANCTEAGCGKLKAHCFGKNRERGVDVIIENYHSKAIYRVKFNPKEPDVYTLTIFFADKLIPSGTFEINLLPKSCAKKVKHLGTFIPDDFAEPVALKFDASKAGPGRMRGRVTGITQAGMVSSRVDLIDEDDVTYHLFFIPEGGDTYNVDVYWNDESIPGSPIYVKIVYPSEVTLSDWVPSDNARKPVQISADTASAGPGVLTASCFGSSSGSHHAEITQDKQSLSKFSISFQPTSPDLYWLHVFFNDTEVKKSPMEIDLRPPPSTPSPQPVDERVVVAPYASEHLEYAIKSDFYQEETTEKQTTKPSVDKLQLYVGEPMTLVVDGAEGLPKATAFGEQTGESTISVCKELDSETYLVKFNPQQPDTYTVAIYVRNVHIPGSPYLVEYFDELVSETSKMSLTTPTRMKRFVGDPLTLLAENIDVDICDLSASVEGEKTGKGIVSINSTKKKGSFKIRFNPMVPDTYTIKISHFGSGIPGSPFIVEYMERQPVKGDNDVELEPNSLVPTPDTVVAVEESVREHPINKPYLIKCVGIQKDLKGVLAYTVHDDSCVREILRIRRSHGKKPLLVFYPKNLGLHWVHVKHGSKEIEGSPFKLKIVKSACKVLSAPKEAYVDDLVEIKIDASGAGEGDMNILATVPQGGKGTSFSHTSDDGGIYTIMFTPKVPGRYKVQVKWAGVVIPDSPISMRVLNLTDKMRHAREAASKVFIVKDKDSRQIPSKLTHFDVNTEKAGGGELSILSQGPITPKIYVYQQGKGLYSCHVLPTVSGRYEITVLWNGIPIPGNPYKIDFITNKSYIISNLDLETEKFVLSQPCNFLVDCGKNEGCLTVSATPLDSANIDISPLENNTYSVTVTPQVSGNHEISVKFLDQYVLKSPYYVQFESPDQYVTEGRVSRLSELNLSFQDTTASNMAIPSESLERINDAEERSQVRAKGPGLVEGVVGQEGNFSIDTNGVGDGKLEVLVQGPRGSFQTKLRRHPDNERTLLARYDPTHTGKYTISILWNGKHIDSSPFEVSVRKQE